jgi:hypothetical protein
MVDAIITIFLIAILGSLTVPVTMLALARLGYFEPIIFEVRGKTVRFAPPVPTLSRYSTYLSGNARLTASIAVMCLHFHAGTETPSMSNIASRSPSGTSVRVAPIGLNP